MTEPLAIEVCNLEKRYETTGVQALAGVSFGVDKGEIFGYLGRNGAGKSTTVRILTTLLQPTTGQAVVGGFDVSSQPAAVRRVIGAALQEVALDDLMTGREHLVLAARLTGLARNQSRQRADELLETFGLQAAADRIAGRYSGGMRRRLDVAMAMIRQPDVLFLDEPTTGLDPQGRRALWALVRELRDRGSTVFLTTQNLEEADEVAARVAIVHEGRLSAIGSPGELKTKFGGATTIRVRADAVVAARVDEATGPSMCDQSDDGWLEVRVDGNAAGDVLRTIARLEAAGVEMEYLSVRGPSLEDVFVNLTGAEIELGGDSADAGAVATIRQAQGAVNVRAR